MPKTCSNGSHAKVSLKRLKAEPFWHLPTRQQQQKPTRSASTTATETETHRAEIFAYSKYLSRI